MRPNEAFLQKSKSRSYTSAYLVMECITTHLYKVCKSREMHCHIQEEYANQKAACFEMSKKLFSTAPCDAIVSWIQVATGNAQPIPLVPWVPSRDQVDVPIALHRQCLAANDGSKALQHRKLWECRSVVAIEGPGMPEK